ncbi:hypothetical protein FJZ53_03155 [Candidatus Woesearchaeota archaeon]|nr:hypothetical protein [Candidatus Woesearchaeota archaeon]
MKKEIEKKYLLKEGGKEYSTKLLDKIFKNLSELERIVSKRGKIIKQGYLPLEYGKEICQLLGLPYEFSPVEVRLRQKGKEYFFTMKSQGVLSRDELPDVKISKRLFDKYWPKTQGRRVEKIRLAQTFDSKHTEYKLEVDVYTDRDLVVAEVETGNEEEASKLPKLGKDVTEDRKYKNKNLAR